MTTGAVRVATVSLNPAIDQTASVPNFTAGAVNRVEREQSDAGGKGVNVASFLAHTGHAVAVTGLLGSDNATLFERLFDENRIVDRFVRLRGSTRVNVKIVDTANDRVTDINFPGLRPAPADLAALTAAVDALAETAEWFVLTGSVPADVPSNFYATLIARLKARGRTAMELLQNGVDRVVIALWLGHESIETTQVYMHADMRLKEKALERVTPPDSPPGRFRPGDALLEFLEAL